MSDADADAAALRAWVEALDTFTHYDLFQLRPDATYDDLRAAFHAFAAAFHPDRHLGRSPEEQAAVGRIYRRGAEAWRVLSDPALRERYDAAIASGRGRDDDPPVERESLAPPSGPVRLVDRVRAPGARPFVLRAEELIQNGDPKQARIQLVMAMHIDRGNPALEAFAARLDATLRGKSTP